MQNIHERKQIQKFNFKTFAKTTLFINLLKTSLYLMRFKQSSFPITEIVH